MAAEQREPGAQQDETGRALHQPVMRDLVCERLLASAGGVAGTYVDATFGRGGHSRALLERLGPAGRVVALDRDPQAIAAAREAFADEPRLTVRHTRFARVRAVLDELGIDRVDGVLMDLGVSSPQLEEAARGFSFLRDGPLDMRMDTASGETAAQWLAHAEPAALARVLREYGEEPKARRLADALVAARAQAPIATTARLVEIVAGVLGPRREGHRHPATRVFQALRMQVNDELGELRAALEAVPDVLAPGGVLCVISFHSLEDRLVKRFMRDRARVDPKLSRLPVVPEHARPTFELLGRAARADAEEVSVNPRARSAVLRAARRLNTAAGGERG